MRRVAVMGRWDTLDSMSRLLAIGLAIAGPLVVAFTALVMVDWRTVEPANVALTLDGELRGETIRMWGQTDLPDGTELSWTIATDEYGPGRTDLRGETLVSDGQFQVEQRFVALASGAPVMIAVSFYPGEEQPQGVVDRFGVEGERLRGGGLRFDSESPFWYVERTVEATAN
jgi:hypothetical protein